MIYCEAASSVVLAFTAEGAGGAVSLGEKPLCLVVLGQFEQGSMVA